MSRLGPGWTWDEGVGKRGSREASNNPREFTDRRQEGRGEED